MYPHKLDRFRLIEIITRTKRKIQGIRQKEIADEAGIPNQAYVSKVEHLSGAVSDPSYRVSREAFLKIVSKGLGFMPESLDALAWLFDGKVLTRGEVRQYLPEHEQTCTEIPDEQELRSSVLGLLQEALDYRYQLAADDSKYQPAATRTRVSQFLPGDAQEALLEMEKGPGHHMIVTPYPSYLTRPVSIDKDEASLKNQFKNYDEWFEYVENRRNVFLNNLKEYGERSIHHRNSIRKYAQEDEIGGVTRPYLNKTQRRQHIEHWIKLLESHEHYDIRLAEETPFFEIGIKSFTQVRIIAFRRHEIGQEIKPDQSQTTPDHWGPRFIRWFDEIPVLTFILNFEQTWIELSKNQDKRKAINFLKNLNK